MKITYKGDYALKAILDLSINYGNGVITIQDISRQADIPIKFLEQVLLELKRGGFVESRRGKAGGYLLAKPPSQITVGDIVRFIDGPIEPIACAGKKYSGCNEMYRCAFRKIWQSTARAISLIIDTVTFEDLARETSRKEKEVVYSI